MERSGNRQKQTRQRDASSLRRWRLERRTILLLGALAMSAVLYGCGSSLGGTRVRADSPESGPPAPAPLHVFKGHGRTLEAVAFSPDGAVLATGSRDATARLWDVRTGQALATLPHTDYVDELAFSPDGRLLATGGSNNPLRLWKVPTRQLHLELPSARPPAAFSPDGRTLAHGALQRAELRDPATGSLRRSLQGHESLIAGLAYSPDGKILATTGEPRYGLTSSLILWDPATGRRKASRRWQSQLPGAPLFSSDGRFVATAWMKARLWTVPDAEPARIIPRMYTQPAPVLPSEPTVVPHRPPFEENFFHP
jgi:WD40 repeat protein